MPKRATSSPAISHSPHSLTVIGSNNPPSMKVFCSPKANRMKWAQNLVGRSEIKGKATQQCATAGRWRVGTARRGGRALPWIRVGLLPDQVFEILSGDREDVHVLFEGAEAHQAFRKQLAGAFLQRFGLQAGHHLDNPLPFPHVRAFIGPDIISDVAQ